MSRILFVCLGNICRSPTAEGVMLHILQECGITSFTVDSAGTSAYHVGEAADRRSQQVANQRGIHLPSRARQFISADFERFDLILAMDQSNLMTILRMAKTDAHRQKVHLFMDAIPNSTKGQSVPDPYYQDNFEEVLDICEMGCKGWLQMLTAER